jgi:Fe-Mn family superoxide dismutase
MSLALQASFGSVDAWWAAFTALRPARLVFLPREGRLVNRAAAGPLGGVLLLAHDTPQPQRAPDAIYWPAVYQRYQDAVHAASAPFAATPQAAPGALLFDVRRAGVFEQAAAMIPGAAWRDPALVDAWAGDLPTDREVLVYCVYGHEVGRSTAMRLRAAGINARFLQGGIDGWQAAGLPLVARADLGRPGPVDAA